MKVAWKPCCFATLLHDQPVREHVVRHVRGVREADVDLVL